MGWPTCKADQREALIHPLKIRCAEGFRCITRTAGLATFVGPLAPIRERARVSF